MFKYKMYFLIPLLCLFSINVIVRVWLGGWQQKSRDFFLESHLTHKNPDASPRVARLALNPLLNSGGTCSCTASLSPLDGSNVQAMERNQCFDWVEAGR